MESLELFRLMPIIQAWYFLRQISNYYAINTRAVHQRFVQASGTFIKMRVIQDCHQLLKELSTLFVMLLECSPVQHAMCTLPPVSHYYY